MAKLDGISTCPPSVFIWCTILNHESFARDVVTLLIMAIFLVSGMMVFDYGLECAHLSPMRDVAF